MEDTSRASDPVQAGDFASRYGPWAAVLGGGQGIGRALAEASARRGLHVLLVDQRRDLMAEAQTRVLAAARAAGHADCEVAAARVDLGAPDAADRLAEAAEGRDVGLMVYTAMMTLVGPFLDHDLTRHQKALAVGCGGLLAASHLFGRQLRARGKGGLVLTSSLAGFQGTGWVAGYSACKAYDLALAEALWWELRPHGVDVLALCPGNVDTPGLRDTHPKLPDGAMARPEDVAEEALDALGREHLLIPGADNRKIRKALEELPRRRLVEVMGENTRAQYAE